MARSPISIAALVGAGVIETKAPIFARFPKFSAKVSAMLSGGDDVPVVETGDSTTAAMSAITAGSLDGAKPVSTPTVFAQLLNAAGYRAHSLTFNGENGTTGGASLALYDPRISFGNAADWTSASMTLGKAMNRTSVSGSRFIFTPGVETDSAEFIIANGGACVAGVYLDGGGTAIATINQLAGNASYQKVIVTYPRGVHTIELARISGSGTFYPAAGRFKDSTKKSIIVHNGGWPSGKVADIAGTTDAWGPRYILAELRPAITIINIGINDRATIGDGVAFKAQYQTLIDTARSVDSEVLAVVPNPQTSDSGGPAMRQYVREIAAANNVPIADIFARWGSGAAAQAAGLLSSDGVHRTALGNADVAQLYMDVLQSAA